MPHYPSETCGDTNNLSLSTISHELKNPLTLIHSTLQILGSHHPDITRDPLWSQLILDVDYMTQLLSELSSLNNSQKLNYTQLSLRQILTNIVAAFSPLALSQHKNIGLNFQMDQDLFYGDSIKIREIFINLIKNALEATNAGDHISIDVRIQWKCFIVIVGDTGKGMDESILATIFKPFITYKPAGTGLGLTIVKNIVNAHGGTIQAYSKPGIGTKFILSLPLLPPSASAFKQENKG